MGQGNSKKDRRAATQVDRRTKDGGRRDRPHSFTFGEQDPSPSMDLNPQRFGQSPNSASMDLTGLRFHGYPNDPDIRTNPIGAEDMQDHGDGVSSQQHVVQHNTRKQDSKGDQKASYYASLEDVLGIWPEYEPLKELKFSKISAPLQQVFKRLVEQHTSIGKMSRDNHDLRQKAQNLKSDLDSLDQLVKEKEQELKECVEDIGYLRGELKRKGFDPKVPARHQSEKRPSMVLDTVDHRQHTRNSSDHSDTVFEDPKDEIEHKMRHKESRGQAVALPLLVAAGREGQENILRRHSSFKGTNQATFDREHRSSFRAEHRSSVHGERDRDRDTPRSEDQNRLIENLNDKIRRLEALLENERRSSSNLLRRLDESFNDKASSRGSTTGKIGQSVDGISRQYSDLESTAIFKIVPSMDRLLGHVREHRKQEFLCAIMERCYDQAGRHLGKFEKAVRGVLQHPLETSGARKRDTGRSGRVSSNSEVPGALLDKLIEYLETTSDHVEITPLVQMIIDDLQDEFNDCTTAGLLNQTAFNNFIYDCARIAWKMILVTPPMTISTEAHLGYDSEKHTIASSDVLNPRDGHEIKVYLWPSLLNRRRGDVLNKGRVILKVDR